MSDKINPDHTTTSAMTCFDNRELSWLKFNERVLEEAEDSRVPLCERLSFAAIFQSNLDEFFMIRVGTLCDQMLLPEETRENKTNMTSEEQLTAIFQRVKELTPRKDEAYSEILRLLREYHVEQVDFKNVNPLEEEHTLAYFNREIKPLISPQILDKRHPFPFFKNKEIYAAAYIEKLDKKEKSGGKQPVMLGIVPCNADVFQRLLILPGTTEGIRFMLIEDLILHYMPQIFEGYRILNKSLLRITRNADINPEEALYDHDMDYRDVMTDLLKQRKKLSPVRMELSRPLGAPALQFLCQRLELDEEQIFYSQSPLDLSFVYPLSGNLSQITHLFFPKITPQRSSFLDDFSPLIPQIQQKDRLLSYPYESIKPFIKLLIEAGDDPEVVSVKITLYRVAKNSKIVEALVNMAERGKEVLVLVELRARFDEENNIEWSKRLEEAGCTVIYGLEGLKVHSKLLLITRKCGSKIEYITQIGTGNYNEKTAALYTDLCLMTANREIGAEASVVFNALSMGNCVESVQHLLVAPLCLQNKVLEKIDAEITEAKKGNPAYVAAKLNSLTDKIIIDKLIEASQAGVKIDLVIRGICCLIAGVEGYTENIRVISIVGRFLEHSRIYMFGTPGRRQMYIASADFMTRNTLRRVEVGAPIYDPEIRDRLERYFQLLLRDNIKSRIQGPDGIYHRRQEEDAPLNSQEYLVQRAYERAEKLPTAPPLRKKNFMQKFQERLSKFGHRS